MERKLSDVPPGDLVTFNGATYRCITGHTSQAGWTPAAVPALWAVV
ncbi:carbohydrate-binding protein [Gulosibacter massiliensis]